MKKAFLQSHALFGGLSDEDLADVEPMLKEEHFKKGEFIFREGDEGNTLFFLFKGSVEILKEVDTPDGKELKQLAVLGEGESIGEMELIDIERRSASVRVIEDVDAVTLSNADLYHLYKKNPHAHVMIIMNVAREISRRLRRMDELFGHELFSR